MKKLLLLFILMFFVGLIAISGCTSNQGDKTYNSNLVSFQYPSSWSIEKEGSNWVRFKAPDGLVRVGVDNSNESDVDLTNFQDSKKIGNNTCYILVTGGTKTYLVKQDGKDLTVMGSIGESNGMEKIVETFKFK